MNINCFFLLLVVIIEMMLSCGQPTSHLIYYEGTTMGTTYHVRIYTPAMVSGLDQELKRATDSLLYCINQGISTYEKNSVISLFNKNRTSQVVFPKVDSIRNSLPHFFNALRNAQLAYVQSGGNFDPTVMPLVNYWGFGYTGRHQVTLPDTALIEHLRQHVGFDKIQFSWNDSTMAYTLIKSDSLVELDFGGIGQGYGSDQIAGLLDQHGFTDYLVELGGELVAKGNKPDGSQWTVGLNTPLEEADTKEIFSKVQLKDKALTTSGNYRNFYKSGDQTFSHTINPKTGFPERSTLLSVSLIGQDCTSIDAMATACMTMGMQKCSDIVVGLQMEAYFIYRAGDSLKIDMTDGFKAYLTK